MHEADKVLSVRFFLHAQENPKKSKEEGRPIFEEVEMISIMAPGNTKTEFTARADRQHWDVNAKRQWTYKERFAEHYAQFSQGLEEQVMGTPIVEVPFLSMSEKAELRADGVKTVEQLAGMSDTNIRRKGMGYRARVDKARAYLDSANGTAALSEEMAKLRQRIAELEGGEKPPEPTAEDDTSGYDQYSDDDLRNMLADAGKAPDGRWGRSRLIDEMRALAKEAA